MLPRTLRYNLFESLSVKTMRYVDAVPTKHATGLLSEIYQQISDDFFINGSLTSHSAVPALLAGVWMGGREVILQPDRLDQKTKEAMAATLSRVNDCAYCGDMLVSLVKSAGDPSAAKGIFDGSDAGLKDRTLEKRLQWVTQAGTPGNALPDQLPFTREEAPEAIATLLAMGHINRYSHIVMDGSPVPFGRSQAKFGALSLFSLELKEVVAAPLQKGRALHLLPAADLPNDMTWAAGNPRIADALSRWAAVIAREARPAVPAAVQTLLEARLRIWEGEAMPLSRAWLEESVSALQEEDQATGRLCLVTALSPWQFSDDLVNALPDGGKDKARLVRVLNYAAFSGARRIAERLGQHYLTGTHALGAA